MMISSRIAKALFVVGVVLVGRTQSAPDMFTARIDMQRALIDEQSAATLLQQYVSVELRRLQELRRCVSKRLSLQDTAAHCWSG